MQKHGMAIPEHDMGSGMNRLEHRIVIVGCGLSGIAVAVKLREAGIHDFVILEKADRPGGTWRENTYPGCGCDVPSVFYSYSFNLNPDWNYAYARQPEIQAYIEDTVAREHLAPRIRYHTELQEARWDEHARRWALDTSAGIYRAQFVIFACGPITEPSIPDIPGLKDFTGPVFHSARWRHDVNLAGQRVAVVGTGASAIQFVPELQKTARQLTVFQRTAPWVFQRPNPKIPAWLKRVHRQFPVTQQLERAAIETLVLGVNYGLTHPKVMEAIEPAAKAQLRRRVPDASLYAKVEPNFTIGCKRILFSNDWYETLQQPNVELIDAGLARVEGNVVVSSRGESREVDAIVFGTGFDVTHPPVAKRIRCATGELLAERWAEEGPQAYLGSTMADLPNAFLMVGPNIVVYSSFISVAEYQCNYVVDAIRQADARGVEVFRLPREFQRAYNIEVQRKLQPTVWNSGKCVSYYLDEHGRNLAGWPGTIPQLKKKLSRFDLVNYQVWPYREGAHREAVPVTA